MTNSMEGMVVYTYDPKAPELDILGKLTQIRFPDGRILEGEELRAYWLSRTDKTAEEQADSKGDDPNSQA